MDLQQLPPIVENNFHWVIVAWLVLVVFFVVLFGGALAIRSLAEEELNEKGDL